MLKGEEPQPAPGWEQMLMAARTVEEVRAAYVMRDAGLELPAASIDEMSDEDRAAWAKHVLAQVAPPAGADSATARSRDDA